MSQARVAARLARRELRARPWRTLLVAVFIAVPVAGMVFGSVFVRTLSQDADRPFGQADIVVKRHSLRTGDGPPSFDPAALVPGARSARLVRDLATLRTVDGVYKQSHVVSGDVASPIIDGVISVFDGRLPRTPREVALSPDMARKFGVRAGDRLSLQRPPIGLRVVGVAAFTQSYNDPLVLLAGSPTLPAAARWSEETYIDVPDGADLAPIRQAVAATWTDNTPGRIVASTSFDRQYTYNEPGQFDGFGDEENMQEAVNWTYVAGSLVLVVLGIVIAAAFAVGARRQLHTLGTLASNGAEPRVLRNVLLVHGAACGAAGVLLGYALGAAALAAFAPHRNWLAARVVDRWNFWPRDLIPIAVIGVLAAVIAAAQPARSASRLSVLSALAGQRPASPVARWVVPTGLASFVAGLLMLATATSSANDPSGDSTQLTLLAIAGGVSVLLGACSVAPLVVTQMERAGAHLRGTWRLAARSLVRQRARTSGVIAAIAAATALVITGAAGTLAVAAAEPERTPMADDVAVVSGLRSRDGNGAVQRTPPDPSTVDAVARVIGGRERVAMRRLWVQFLVPDVVLPSSGPVVSSASSQVNAAIGTAELVAFLGAGPGAAGALSRGIPVLVEPDRAGQRVEAEVLPYRPPGMPGVPGAPVGERARRDRVNVLVVDGIRDSALLPNLLLPQTIVDGLGDAVVVGNQEVLVRGANAISDGERTKLRALDHAVIGRALEDLSVNQEPSAVRWNERGVEATSTVVQSVLLGVALLFTLVVIAVGLGLAASEGKAERDVLVAVGAKPRSLARLAGIKAVVMSFVGAVLAIPTALLPVWVWARVSDPREEFRVPWLVLFALVVGVPIAAGAITTAASAIGARFHPVRASAFAAE